MLMLLRAHTQQQRARERAARRTRARRWRAPLRAAPCALFTLFVVFARAARAGGARRTSARRTYASREQYARAARAARALCYAARAHSDSAVTCCQRDTIARGAAGDGGEARALAHVFIIIHDGAHEARARRDGALAPRAAPRQQLRCWRRALARRAAKKHYARITRRARRCRARGWRALLSVTRSAAAFMRVDAAHARARLLQKAKRRRRATR